MPITTSVFRNAKPHQDAFTSNFAYGRHVNSKIYSPADHRFTTNTTSYSDANIWRPPSTEEQFQPKPMSKCQGSRYKTISNLNPVNIVDDRRPEKLSLTLPPIGRPCNQHKNTGDFDRPSSHRDDPLSANSRSARTESTTLTPSSRSMSDSGHSITQGEMHLNTYNTQASNSGVFNKVEPLCKWDRIGEFRPSAQVSRSLTTHSPWYEPDRNPSLSTDRNATHPIMRGQAQPGYYGKFPAVQYGGQSRYQHRMGTADEGKVDYYQMNKARALQPINNANLNAVSMRSDSRQMVEQQNVLFHGFQSLSMNSNDDKGTNVAATQKTQLEFHSKRIPATNRDAKLTMPLPSPRNSEIIYNPLSAALGSSRYANYAQFLNESSYEAPYAQGVGASTKSENHHSSYSGQDDVCQSQPYNFDYYYPNGPRSSNTYDSVNSGRNVANAVPYEVPGAPLGAQHESTHVVRSQVLEDFRMNHKTRKFEFREIHGYIVEFSGDQLGSRFIQHKLETANSDEKDQVFAEIAHDARQLMTDVFGNYVIQKLFEHGNQSQKKVLANQMRGHILALSTQAYGCRVVQKAFEHILTDQQASLVRELDGHVLKVVENQNGNHVIQKAIECIPGEHVDFIIQAHRGHVHYLSKHSYGCRVIQRMLEYCQPPAKRVILDELHHNIADLIQDPFGNYVVQHVIVNGEACDRKPVIDKVRIKLLDNAMHKFASNVVEKAMDYADEEQRSSMLQVLTSRDDNGQRIPTKLLNHQFGNYVIRKSNRQANHISCC